MIVSETLDYNGILKKNLPKVEISYLLCLYLTITGNLTRLANLINYSRELFSTWQNCHISELPLSKKTEVWRFSKVQQHQEDGVCSCG